MPRYDLELDGGNTQLKFRCVGGITESGRLSESDWQHGFAALFARYGQPEVIRFAAVWAPERKVRLHQALGACSTLLVEAKVVQGVAGLQIADEQPQRLGVDRWLAMLAARSHVVGRPVLIVDLGTAVTLDYVTADGCHQGGYIVPGLRLAAGALSQNTDCIGTDAGAWGDTAFANNTAGAVYHGAVQQLVALIAASLGLHCDPATELLLTGGDAGIIAPVLRQQLDREFRVLPELVLDGLGIALSHETESACDGSF